MRCLKKSLGFCAMGEENLERIKGVKEINEKEKMSLSLQFMYALLTQAGKDWILVLAPIYMYLGE